MKNNKNVKIILLSIIFLSGFLSIISFENRIHTNIIKKPNNNNIVNRTYNTQTPKTAASWECNFIHISNDSGFLF